MFLADNEFEVDEFCIGHNSLYVPGNPSIHLLRANIVNDISLEEEKTMNRRLQNLLNLLNHGNETDIPIGISGNVHLCLIKGFLSVSFCLFSISFFLHTKKTSKQNKHFVLKK